VALLVAVAAAIADAQQRAPQQQQRTPEEYAKFLEQPDRVARLQIPRVVEALGLKAGMKVADVGAGSGLFTRSFAKAVAPGVVYAVDIDGALLTIIERSSTEAGLKNVKTILGQPSDPGLPGPVDVLFICDSLHHIANQAAYLKTIRKYLSPGGRLAIIDYNKNWPEGHETLQFSPAELEAWTTGAGLTRVASHDWIQDSFFDIYR
jgi:ubiquinone/menaquinone biosynthesis C-methylase UbiE